MIMSVDDKSNLSYTPRKLPMDEYTVYWATKYHRH